MYTLWKIGTSYLRDSQLVKVTDWTVIMRHVFNKTVYSPSSDLGDHFETCLYRDCVLTHPVIWVILLIHVCTETVYSHTQWFGWSFWYMFVSRLCIHTPSDPGDHFDTYVYWNCVFIHPVIGVNNLILFVPRLCIHIPSDLGDHFDTCVYRDCVLTHPVIWMIILIHVCTETIFIHPVIWVIILIQICIETVYSHVQQSGWSFWDLLVPGLYPAIHNTLSPTIRSLTKGNRFHWSSPLASCSK